MRKWHRWLSLFFGCFMVWMAVTGLIIHVNDLLKGDGDRPAKPVVVVSAAAGNIGANATKPAQSISGKGQPLAKADVPSVTDPKLVFVCPVDMTCRPKPKPGKFNFPSFIKHLHSGEIAGPLGTVLSILTGLALLFFSVSGIWMYVQMWRFRRSRKLSPFWFWK